MSRIAVNIETQIHIIKFSGKLEADLFIKGTGGKVNRKVLGLAVHSHTNLL